MPGEAGFASFRTDLRPETQTVRSGEPGCGPNFSKRIKTETGHLRSRSLSRSQETGSAKRSSDDVVLASFAATARQHKLELEIASLRQQLSSMSMELHDTRLHAEQYAQQAVSANRAKAEQALDYQKDLYDRAHDEYSTVVKDICKSEVADATVRLEAAANSFISEQNVHLHNATQIAEDLQQHLTHARQIAEEESQGKLLVEAEAKTAIAEHKASSANQLSVLRVSLEKQATTNHERILKDKEFKIKTEADETHAARMKEKQKQIDDLALQLQKASAKYSDMESELAEAVQSRADSEGNLARLNIELGKTQEALNASNSNLDSIRKSKSFLEKDCNEQLRSHQRLESEITDLKSKIDSLISQRHSQEEASEKEIKELKDSNTKLRGDIESLQLSVAETDKRNSDLIGQLADQEANHQAELESRDLDFAHAQETIEAQRLENEELQDAFQQEINKEFESRQKPAEAQENYQLDRDDSVEPQPAASAAAASAPVPANQSCSIRNHLKNWIDESITRPTPVEAAREVKNTKVSYNPLVLQPSPAAAAAEAAHKKEQAARAAEVLEQIAPFAGNLSQDFAAGGVTPNLSAIPPPATFQTGKKTSDKLDIGGWPSIKTFRAWKLRFWKAVAAASVRPDAAFEWINKVRKCCAVEDLADSEGFPELDALLATEWDKIIQGEFRKRVQVLEYQLLDQNKMIKGRQITWMVFDNFRLADVDGQLLNHDEIMKLELKMPGDNLMQYLNDWDTTFLHINQMPDDHFLESMFRRQLEKSQKLKSLMALYHQGITHEGKERSYQRLRIMVETYLDDNLLRRNQAALTSSGRGANAFVGVDGKVQARSGYCNKWSKQGECAAGGKCPWAASHTEENRAWYKYQPEVDEKGKVKASSKGKGKGKGKGKSKKGRSASPSQNRGRPENRGDRKPSPKRSLSPNSKAKAKAKAEPKRRGKSPSGETDRPVCFRWLKGLCTDKNCRYHHSGPCKDFNSDKGCKKGNKCEFVHHTDAVKANIAKSKVAKAKAGARCARFFTPIFEEDFPIKSPSQEEAAEAIEIIDVPSSPYPRCCVCRKPIGQGPECRTTFCGLPVHSNCFCEHLNRCGPCNAPRPPRTEEESRTQVQAGKTTEVPAAPYPPCCECRRPVGQYRGECQTTFCGKPCHHNCCVQHLMHCYDCNHLPPLPPTPSARMAHRSCAFLYRAQPPRFSPEDVKKSLKDATAPPYQPRNSKFVPHRTDGDGNVTFDDQDTIDHYEEGARRNALNLRIELYPDTEGDSFFITGSDERKVYSFKPSSDESSTALSKSQKRKKRKDAKAKARLEAGNAEDDSAQARSSSPSPRARRYIVDSGASFHLVDPRTLTKEESATIEETEPIPIETANGEVTVDKRCRVRVVELDLPIWAYLHEDTVCVLSLGLLVDRDGFTYKWEPGKAPTLKKGSFSVSCVPHYNVPFIYSAKARGLPLAKPVTTGPSTFQKIVEEEMKGLEDLIPPPPEPYVAKDGDNVDSAVRKNRQRGQPRG